MIGIFGQLIKAGLDLGDITQAFMYESGFMSIEGKKRDGKEFSITLSIKEEEKNGN